MVGGWVLFVWKAFTTKKKEKYQNIQLYFWLLGEKKGEEILVSIPLVLLNGFLPLELNMFLEIPN